MHFDLKSYLNAMYKLYTSLLYIYKLKYSIYIQFIAIIILLKCFRADVLTNVNSSL